MADYGNKNSTKRGEWYDKVISPLKNSGKNVPNSKWNKLPNRAQWMAEARGATSGSKLHHTKWPKKMSDLAKLVSTATGTSWSAGKLSTISKGETFTTELLLASQVMAQEAPLVDEIASEGDDFASTSGAGEDEELSFIDEGYDSGAGYALTDAGGGGSYPPAETGMPTWAVVLLSATGVSAFIGGALLMVKAFRRD